MRHGRRAIRIAMSIAVFRVVVVRWIVVIIRMLDPIPGLDHVFPPQSDGMGAIAKSMAYLVLVPCIRLSIPLGAGTAMCGSMTWVVLCPTVTVQLRAVDRRRVT